MPTTASTARRLVVGAVLTGAVLAGHAGAALADTTTTEVTSATTSTQATAAGDLTAVPGDGAEESHLPAGKRVVTAKDDVTAAPADDETAAESAGLNRRVAVRRITA